MISHPPNKIGKTKEYLMIMMKMQDCEMGFSPNSRAICLYLFVNGEAAATKGLVLLIGGGAVKGT